MEQEECIYCGALVPHEDVDYVPGSTDDDSWEDLALQHFDDCEWIETRAFRVVE